MSESNLPEMAPAMESLFWEAGVRRKAVVDVIRSAREELALSLFRCDDFAILDELADAVARNVKVRALVTPTAKNWDRRLRELETTLGSMGASVHRYRGGLTKYHAKYIVADHHTALVASLNFTRKCFDQTGDFVVTTRDEGVIRSLSQLFHHDCEAEGALPSGLSPRLVIGPDYSRRLLDALESAKSTIRVVDHRLNDPEAMAILRRQQERGVSVVVLGEGALPQLASHGRLFLVDGRLAMIGSFALTSASLRERREIALELTHPALVDPLKEWFDRCAQLRPAESLRLAEFVGGDPADDD